MSDDRLADRSGSRLSIDGSGELVSSLICRPFGQYVHMVDCVVGCPDAGSVRMIIWITSCLFSGVGGCSEDEKLAAKGEGSHRCSW